MTWQNIIIVIIIIFNYRFYCIHYREELMCITTVHGKSKSETLKMKTNGKINMENETK